MAENAMVASRCEIDQRAAAKWNLRTALALAQQARLWHWHLLLPSRRDLAYFFFWLAYMGRSHCLCFA